MPAMLVICIVAGFGPRGERAGWRLVAALALAAMPLAVASAAHPERLMARAQAASVLGNLQPLGAAVGLLVKQYVAHYAPGFLFIHGDGNPLHSPGGVGELSWPLIVALPAGLWIAARRRDPWDRLLLCWFLLYPIASAASLGDRPEYVPHSLRAAVGLPAFEIIGGLGIDGWMDRIRSGGARRAVWIALASAAAVNLAVFSIAFTGRYARTVEPLYHAAHVRAIRFVAARAGAAETVLIDARDDPQAYVHAILYGLQSPREYQSADKVLTQTETFHLVHRAGRIFYIHGPEDVAAARSRMSGRVLAIIPPGEMRAGRVLATFPYANGLPGLEVREVILAAEPSQRK